MIPDEFDWVTARAECNTFAGFKRLQDGVKSDVATRDVQSGPRERFSIDSLSEKSFRVLRSVSGRSVTFTMEGDVVIARNGTGGVMIEGTFLLDDEGRCVIRLKDGQELRFWQFRKRALEDLLFG